MKVGIIGRTGSGRSTLFEALTAGGAPRQPGRMRLGVARVWDSRVDELSRLCQPKKTVYAEISLAVPPGALDVAALREMRDLRAFAHVVGAFADDADGAVDAAVTEQVNELCTEMVLADMERVEKRLARIAKGGGDRPGEKDALQRAAEVLEREEVLRKSSWDEQASGLLDELGIVSHRPLLTVINVGEGQLGGELGEAAGAALQAVGSQPLWLCAALEREIVELDADAQREFLSAYQLSEPVSQRFAHACLSLLDQICFFTVGPDEVRAWPIPKNTRARRAARAIHSDLEKGFIRAEVIDYGVFLEQGSEAKCRAVGQLRVEGKDYVVQDGDIITVRFNV